MIEHNEGCGNDDCPGCNEAHKNDPECDDLHPRHYRGTIYEGQNEFLQMAVRMCPHSLASLTSQLLPQDNALLQLPADTADDERFRIESRDHKREAYDRASGKWRSGKGDSDRYMREPEEMRVYPEVQGIAEVEDLAF